MSKAELVATVQKSLWKEASFAQAERTVDAVIEGIKIGVKKTKSVQLVGFGTFKIATRKVRMASIQRQAKDQSQKDGQIRTRKSSKKL
jgi:nucleoid DNA-binding protein